jgi:hypothetical protein
MMVLHLWDIPSQWPAIADQHAMPPLALVSLLLLGYFLVKLFFMLITNNAQVFWEESIYGPRKINFELHFASHDFVGFETFFNK